MGECVVAPTAILQQDCLAVRPREGEHLEDAGRDLTLPVRIADGHADRNAQSLFDELGRLEAASFAVMLLEEVDHLPAVASDRRLAGEAAAGDAEPLRLLCK